VLEDGRIGLVLDVPSLLRDLAVETDSGATGDTRPSAALNAH
jgi:hypothetical protein